MWTRICLVLIILATISPILATDLVVLTNGDRVSGTINESDKESISLSSSLLGDLKVPWSAIAEIQTEQDLYVSEAGGQVLVGKVSGSPGKYQVTTSQATIDVDLASVEAIRSQAAHDAHVAELEKLRNPGLGDFWSGTVDFGMSFVGGNSSSGSINSAARAVRETTRDRFTVSFLTIYNRNSNLGFSQVTANSFRGGLRYDLNTSERTFIYGFYNAEVDEFQDLDLRSVVGGGLGWKALRSERFELDVLGGGAFNQEFFVTALDRSSAEATAGEQLTWKITPVTDFTQSLIFYPNLSELGEFRMQFDSTLSIVIADWLSWRNTFSDRYLSNPPLGFKTNDLFFTTGLGFTFGKK